MKRKVIGEGAEAIIYFDDKSKSIEKLRINKLYRERQIDIELRKKRTRQESRILRKLAKEGFPSPREIKTDEATFSLFIEFIDGKKVRDILTQKNCKKIARELARLIFWLHKLNVVHHDLTTSNMIISDGRLFLIDFGLSFVSKKIEDKAVDIHLLKRAIESKHPEIFDEFMKEFSSNYSKEKEGKEVLKRVEIVDSRGRYK
jgi:TP53 regulating kinase-like protein